MCCTSYSPSLMAMSKIRTFIRELCRNGQIRTLLVPSPDKETSEKLKNQVLENITNKCFFILLEREFLEAYLEIDFDDIEKSNEE